MLRKQLYPSIIAIFCLGGLGTLTTVHGQMVKLGLTASPTFSIVSSDNNRVLPDGSALGVTYGILTDFQIGNQNRYAFMSGFTLHHTKGRFLSQASEYEVKVTLIEMPATFKLQTNEISGRNFYGQFGMHVGVPVSSRVFEGSEDQVDIKGLYSAINFALGVNFHLYNQGVILNTGVYFNNGFTNIFEIEGETFTLKHIGIRCAVYF